MWDRCKMPWNRAMDVTHEICCLKWRQGALVFSPKPTNLNEKWLSWTCGFSRKCWWSIPHWSLLCNIGFRKYRWESKINFKNKLYGFTFRNFKRQINGGCRNPLNKIINERPTPEFNPAAYEPCGPRATWQFTNCWRELDRRSKRRNKYRPQFLVENLWREPSKKNLHKISVFRTIKNLPSGSRQTSFPLLINSLCVPLKKSSPRSFLSSTAILMPRNARFPVTISKKVDKKVKIHCKIANWLGNHLN